MALMEELKERWKAIFLERESVEKRADELAVKPQDRGKMRLSAGNARRIRAALGASPVCC